MEPLGALLGLVCELVLVGTARVVVPLVTLGHWRGERLTSNEGRIYGPAGALSFKHEGQRIVTSHGLLFIGIAFYLVVCGLLLWWFAS